MIGVLGTSCFIPQLLIAAASSPQAPLSTPENTPSSLKDVDQIIAHGAELMNGVPALLGDLSSLYRVALRPQLSFEERASYNSRLLEAQRRHSDLNWHNAYVNRPGLDLIEFSPTTYNEALDLIGLLWEPMQLSSLRRCVLQEEGRSAVPDLIVSAARSFDRRLASVLRRDLTV